MPKERHAESYKEVKFLYEKETLHLKTGKGKDRQINESHIKCSVIGCIIEFYG